MIIDNGVDTHLLFTEINDAVEALAGDRVVVVNSHDSPADIPKGAICFNFENVPLQVSPLSFPDNEVWDFSARNVEAWRPRVVTHVPVGYHPTMERFTMRPWEERDIDVVFTGCMNERRRKILDELASRGLNVVRAGPGMYGKERDELLSRAKLSLAVLFYPTGVYGTLRAAHCIANRLPIVSEIAPDMPEWAPKGFKYDEIVEYVCFLLEKGHAPVLQAMADQAYEAFKACPMRLPVSGASRWDGVRKDKPDAEDISRMYEAVRGGPVSENTRVHIAVPFYREPWRVGQTVVNAIGRIIDDLGAHGVESELTRIEGDSLICRMRQRVCHRFLMSSATHLLLCDGDVEPLDPTCVRKMLRSGHDIVAGAAPFKEPNGRVVCNLWPGTMETMEEGTQVGLEHGCIEVMDAGTGFMLLSRQAILTMMAAHPELKHWSRAPQDECAPLWALFDTGIVEGTYQSEDYMLCHHWQELGGKVYCYIPATFRHWGDYGYEGSFCEHYGLNLNAQVAPDPIRP